jgi:sugar phosphate isomerase/epimerase
LRRPKPQWSNPLIQIVFVLQLKLGIQLESLKLPFRQALSAAAELGTQAVEVNARTELRPDEMSRTAIRQVRKMLADLKLAVCSVNLPTRRGYADPSELERRIEATKATMSMAFELGSRVVVIRAGTIPQDPESVPWRTVVEAFSELGRHSQRVGALLAARTGDDPARLAELITALPAGSLYVDFDPGSLAMNGYSPEDALRRLSDHVVSFRAYDGVRDATGQAKHVQLGRGSVDFPLLLGLLEQKQFNGYIVIERQTDTNPILSCQQTVEYLKSLF